MIVLSGKDLSAVFAERLAADVARLTAQGCVPRLAVIRVGDEPATRIYVRNKVRAAERAGIASADRHLPEDTTQEALEAVVAGLNDDPAVHGILCQLPLPPPLDAGRITRLIDPLKDVDCFHPYNVGLMSLGEPRFLPCTPAGVLALLSHHDVPVQGRRAVVVGRSNIVGRPLSILLSQRCWNATVTLCHTRTHRVETLMREADILVAATGRPEWITGDMVKQGAVVVDVGINRVDDPGSERGYRLCGDVHYPSVAPRSAAITPVPGGVGPMTIAMVLQNTLAAAKLQHRIAPG